MSIGSKKAPYYKGAFLNTAVLFLHVWEKSHEASALDGERYFALVAAREAGAAARHDLCRRSEKLFQDLSVFVVDMLDVV